MLVDDDDADAFTFVCDVDGSTFVVSVFCDAGSFSIFWFRSFILIGLVWFCFLFKFRVQVQKVDID